MWNASRAGSATLAPRETTGSVRHGQEKHRGRPQGGSLQLARSRRRSPSCCARHRRIPRIRKAAALWRRCGPRRLLVFPAPEQRGMSLSTVRVLSTRLTYVGARPASARSSTSARRGTGAACRIPGRCRAAAGSALGSTTRLQNASWIVPPSAVARTSAAGPTPTVALWGPSLVASKMTSTLALPTRLSTGIWRTPVSTSAGLQPQIGDARAGRRQLRVEALSGNQEDRMALDCRIKNGTY